MNGNPEDTWGSAIPLSDPIQPGDRAWMEQACTWGERGRYTAFPNPCVGALVCDAMGNCVGAGYHAKTGLAHAEVMALEAAGSAAQGGTCYVTLEPCVHWGRTGPCADQLIQAGIRRVVIGALDPDPRMRGAGVQRLRAAGCEVTYGLCAQTIGETNRGFFHSQIHQSPWVVAKSAMTLDGRTALANQKARWITGTEARAYVQTWRASCDGLITGIGTVLADDPALTIRPADFPISAQQDPHHPLATWIRFGNQPLLVICDSQLRIPLTARILADPDRVIWIATTAAAIEAQREKYLALKVHRQIHIQVYGDTGQVRLPDLIRHLHQHQYRYIGVEAGPRLTGAFITAGLLQEWQLLMAPTVLGPSAQPLVHIPAPEGIPPSGSTWSFHRQWSVGSDWGIAMRPTPISPASTPAYLKE